jgi:hypothetical protein
MQHIMQHGFVYMHNNTYNEVNLMLKMRSNYAIYLFFCLGTLLCPHELQNIGAKSLQYETWLILRVVNGSTSPVSPQAVGSGCLAMSIVRLVRARFSPMNPRGRCSQSFAKGHSPR